MPSMIAIAHLHAHTQFHYNTSNSLHMLSITITMVYSGFQVGCPTSVIRCPFSRMRELYGKCTHPKIEHAQTFWTAAVPIMHMSVDGI